MTAAMADAPAIAIVLAGQRRGAVNPLAARAGVTHKCLAPIAGKPLLAHVLEALAATPALAEIRISVEPEAEPELAPLLRSSPAARRSGWLRARRALPTASSLPPARMPGRSSSPPPTTCC
jgi:CTP:molybdopterin cytidylyltransferase MocA